MSFHYNPLYDADGYKVGHPKMLATGTTKVYGTWIPRSLKRAHKGISKVVSFGQAMTWRYIHDKFEEHFFFKDAIEEAIHNVGGFQEVGSDFKKGIKEQYKQKALNFTKDMTLYLGMEYDGKHFEDLWDLGYLPIKVKSLPEGIETLPNIPHMTFINTVDGFGWLTLYLETMMSKLAWKASNSATIAKLYRRQAEKWVMKTDSANIDFVDFMCHDFSARGTSGDYDNLAVGLGHATSFLGSDSLVVIPGSRYFYGVGEEEMPIFSVNASEHSVSTTKIFTVGEQQMIADWLEIFPKGILSIVSDTFDLWKLITEYLPANKEAIMARDGKLVIRPDSGDPVDIICGRYQKRLAGMVDTSTFEAYQKAYDGRGEFKTEAQFKGVIELLWDIFGGTVNKQGYKILDPHIGAIYGDAITPERQVEIYQRLEAKGFAATNIVLGVGSFTYEYVTRDTLGFAAKGAWFEVLNDEDGNISNRYQSYNIYKDPITDNGTKKSLKGMCMVSREIVNWDTEEVDYVVYQECDPKWIDKGTMPINHEKDIYDELQVIYQNGRFFNLPTLSDVRERLKQRL